MPLNFFKVGQVHAVTDQAHHGSVLPLVQSEDREFTHPAGQKPIGKARGTAPLNVPQDGEPNLLLESVTGGFVQAVHKLLSRTHAFGHDHDAVIVTAESATGQVIDDLFHVITELGNDGDLGAGGDGAH